MTQGKAPQAVDINIVSQEILPPPLQVKRDVPLTERAQLTAENGRQALQRILERTDPRLFAVIGPCSIHDPEAALDYAHRLRSLADQVKDTMFIAMRVYFEKPRTTVGWKGFVNDPYLDDSFRIDEGLHRARKLLLELAELGLPVGTEALDPITPQYLDDLVTWTAIGARTTESQKHREMSSGLSTPVGFKNGTDGNIQVAINAMKACAEPHHFLGIDQNGQVAVMRTRGNKYSHVVLRGGGRPNYDSVNVSLCEVRLREANLSRNIMVDCSHGNSLKDPALQPLILENIVNQVREGCTSLFGFMLESNLFWGNQPISEDRSTLRYGVSVTDACIDWETTEKSILQAHSMLQNMLPRKETSLE